MNQTAKDLLERMDSDVEAMKRESAARKKVQPLVSQITRAYYRFPGGHPTRLHVSPGIMDELQDSLKQRCDSMETMPATGTIHVLQCPVTEIPDLDGFRWVRELPNAWKCGPIQGDSHA
jgi:hypothetical protein